VKGASIALGTVMTASLLLTYIPLSDVSGSDAARAAWLLPAAGWAGVIIQIARLLKNPQKAPPIRKAVEAYALLMLVGMMLAAIFG
jgi:hypothetical protein